MISRRTFLSSSACLLGFAGAGLKPPVSAAAPEILELIAQQGLQNLVGEEGAETKIWGYNGSVPGPELRLKRGQEQRIRLTNKLDQATTVHWHGLRLDNRYDGVAGLTQKAVEPEQSFDYLIMPPDAGTYWYHPHFRSWEQVARGLYGPLIIEEDTPPLVDQDLVLMVDDWLIDQNNQIHEQSFGALGHWSHGGREGNVPTVNGAFRPRFEVQQGERLRLRIINTANARIMRLQMPQHTLTQIAMDGQPTPPSALTDDIILAPGQRVDVMVDMALDPSSEGVLVENTGGGAYPIAIFAYASDQIKRPHPLDAPIALAPNGALHSVDPTQAQAIDLIMEGGAMGGMAGAFVKGVYWDINGLIERKLIWSFNETAGMPEKPLFDVAQGQPVLIRMINKTAWPHVMHPHGHHAQVVEIDSKPVEPGPWRDSILVHRNQTVSIAFIADNPGKWMFHCHMLEHQAAGMMTWFKVRS